MKKLLTRLSTLLLVLVLGFTFVGCGGGTKNDESTLEIYALSKGYKTEWLTKIANQFKKESWVAEKYPNLTVKISTDDVSSEVGSKMISGARGNTADLVFTTNSACSYYNKTVDEKLAFEDLSDVYNSTVPGESVTLKQKIRSDIYEQMAVETISGGTAYYAVPWVDGFVGLLYNAAFVEAQFGKDYEMPKTTDELKAFCEAINSKGATVSVKTETRAVKPFIFDIQDGNYFTQIYNTWWAQYSGVTGYENFWSGKCYDDDLGEEISNSNRIFDYEKVDDLSHARLKALEVLSELIGYDAEGHKSTYQGITETWNFAEAQMHFINGEGVMMPNGDWFYTENFDEISLYDTTKFNAAFMRVPVISTLIERCTSINNDEQLSFVIDCVDDSDDFNSAKSAYQTKYSLALTESDYTRVYEARNALYRLQGHEAYVPAYATAKDIAKDFLRYMATDKAIELFMEATYGCQTPYQFDLASHELDSKFSVVSTTRADIAKTGIRLRPLQTFRLVAFGGLGNFSANNIDNPATSFCAPNANDRRTPLQIVQKDHEYFNSSEQYYWKKVLNNAGY